MRKLVSIKDIEGKTVESADNFDGELVIHFTDGTSLVMFAYDAEEADDSYPLIEETLVSAIDEATEGELAMLFRQDVIGSVEYRDEVNRREAAKADSDAQAERIQYEALKAKFEGA